MSHSRPPPNRVEQRIKAEARAVLTCLMPRPDDALRKQTALLMILGWILWSFGIARGWLVQGDVVFRGFTIYQLTSFIVWYVFGRIHGLEVDKFLPWVDSGGESSGRTYTGRERDARDDREDGSTGGFVFRSDRDSDDDH